MVEVQLDKICSYADFGEISVDESWTFDEVSRSDTSYITHSYHRYPAKFIPQMANRLIRDHSAEGNLICDPFMGCGTTLVEAMVLKRKSVGVDINPTAYIATKAKTTPIEPKLLQKEILFFQRKTRPLLKDRLSTLQESIKPLIPASSRLDYWHPERTKNDLGLLLALIENVSNEDLKSFLRCAFSHILKNCSRWMMRSVKPTIDRVKIIPEVYGTFFKHVWKMVKKNEQFWKILSLDVRENPKSYVKAELQDCRKLPVEKNTVKVLVTSSPYVTSYEYADLNQLTALWFEYTDTVKNLRKSFIGSSQDKDVTVSLKSNIALSIVEEYQRHGFPKIAKEVYTYFGEMQQAFEEFYRILEPNGTACFVIGDTTLKGINISNSKVFMETCLNLGYKPKKVIKRRIPSVGKILPSIRDPISGRFTTLSNGNGYKKAYSFEYIVIVTK